MTRNYTLLLLLFLGIMPASSRQRTRQEIKGIAQKLIATSNDSRRSKVAVKGHDDFQDELKEVAATTNYTVMAYDKGGFAIIANDDANDAVIGYSATSRFSTSNPALAWYLTFADALYQNFGYYAKYYGYRDDLNDNLTCSRCTLGIVTFLALKKSRHATTGQQQGNDNQQKTLNQYGLSLVIALLLLPLQHTL